MKHSLNFNSSVVLFCILGDDRITKVIIGSVIGDLIIVVISLTFVVVYVRRQGKHLFYCK